MAYTLASDPHPVTTKMAGAPWRNAFSVTPADVDLAKYTSGIYVGVTGDLKVIMTSAPDADTGIVFKNVAVGWHPIAARQIMAATTASQIIGGY